MDCDNFLVAGVVTATMRERLEGLLHDDRAWTRFLNEIFHHALRITAEVVARE